MRILNVSVVVYKVLTLIFRNGWITSWNVQHVCVSGSGLTGVSACGITCTLFIACLCVDAKIKTYKMITNPILWYNDLY